MRRVRLAGPREEGAGRAGAQRPLGRPAARQAGGDRPYPRGRCRPGDGAQHRGRADRENMESGEGDEEGSTSDTSPTPSAGGEVFAVPTAESPSGCAISNL